MNYIMHSESAYESIMHPNVRTNLQIVPEGKTPLCTPNEIVVKLLELKDAGR